jgi:hypothetical protein
MDNVIDDDKSRDSCHNCSSQRGGLPSRGNQAIQRQHEKKYPEERRNDHVAGIRLTVVQNVLDTEEID